MHRKSFFDSQKNVKFTNKRKKNRCTQSQNPNVAKIESENNEPAVITFVAI